jgi:hypothetical protein
MTLHLPRIGRAILLRRGDQSCLGPIARNGAKRAKQPNRFVLALIEQGQDDHHIADSPASYRVATLNLSNDSFVYDARHGSRTGFNELRRQESARASLTVYLARHDVVSDDALRIGI